MGRIATLAEEHYKRFLPKTYQGLTDREDFFRNLETEADQQIDDLTDRLAGPDLPDETFEDRAGRMKNARARAEELVMRETVLLDPATVETERDPKETDYPPSTDPLEPMEAQTPEDQELASAMADFQEASAELAEMPSSQQPPTNPFAPETPDSQPKA